MGANAIPSERIAELARGNEAELLAELKADLLPPTIEAIRHALQPRCPMCQKGAQRWAVRNVLEMAKLVGTQPQIMMAFFQAAGVRDQGEALALMDSGRRLQSLTADATSSLEGIEAEALGFLEELWRLHPERRGAALSRLQGAVPSLPPSTNGAHE